MRVGHRIIEINNQSVVAVPHEKIVTLLASSVGEVKLTSIVLASMLSGPSCLGTALEVWSD